MPRSTLRPWRWFLAGLLAAAPAQAGIEAADLNLTRTISQGDWLRLRLDLLGLNLSYPAYRIYLELKPEGVAFTFSASSGMAQHLEEAGRSETERVLAYHARGIREQVNKLLQEEFPELWPRFQAEEDLQGRYLVPGDDWEDPPKSLAEWRQDRLVLSR
ncbi:MAG: hypothetical protein FJY95_18265 [Candidatus Handelsmanbacteria bacterium]|nr:hypothetical protein [Candidatus Handelsmanbacteria bacterium]